MINFPDFATGKKVEKTKLKEKLPSEENGDKTSASEDTPASDKVSSGDKSSTNDKTPAESDKTPVLPGEKDPDEIDHSRKLMKSEDLILPPSNRFVYDVIK